jgi:Ice-binding-like
MNHLQKHLSASLIALAALLSMAPIQGAWAAGLLGSAESFAVLGATTVTTAGPSVVTGDLGVSPGTACTGFPTPCTDPTNIGGTVNGTIYAGGSVALQAVSAQAQKDAHIAYAALLGQTCTKTYGAVQEIGGLSLGTGVYCFPSSADLAAGTTLTLTGAGPWIFQIGSTLTTGAGSSVVMSSGSGAGAVFWLVGSSATLGANTQFAGNILAVASISLDGGDTVAGRLIALAGAVTMDGAASTVNATANPSGSVPVGNPPFCEEHKKHEKCNQGGGNGPEGCDPGKSSLNSPFDSNDENGGTPGRRSIKR